MRQVSKESIDWYQEKYKVLIAKVGKPKFDKAIKEHCGSCGRRGGTKNHRICQGFPLQEDGTRCGFWKEKRSYHGGCC